MDRKNKNKRHTIMFTSCGLASGELPLVGLAQIASSELAGKSSKGG